ncbi:LacI family DNA-binding transcriptional regulator [Paracoccus sp. JM45]|uniref:LacI family DNA-binding transcriptional regulator n=1 Tax=Paracoccus sp. JM45 TaxID=2283626 RepID=UPI000E6D2576|nr:LacI family DNA-binding transcriptional regulator [Paracoccus sp. JM45]RJE78631.1 LacI family transcriptional regulator [Paracoccus sp. JM45]
MVSIKQIAQHVGVSTATVSNALTGKGRVSADMVDRIRRCADQLGYRPSPAARALKSGQSNILGLVMPDLTNPLFPRIAQSLSIAAEARGLGILIGDSRGDASRQQQAVMRLVDRGVDGLIIVPQKGTSPEAPRHVPTVIINTASDQRTTVSADHVGGGILLGAHIAGLGHNDVILLGGDRISQVQQDRIDGMTQGLGAAVTKHILWGKSAFDQLDRLVSQGATAIMATSDMLALGAHSALMQISLSVPADVSLTGFDDLPLGTAMHPALTTVVQNTQAIAEHSLDVLSCLILDRPAPPLGRVIPMHLVTRHSTAAPRRAANS